MGITAAIVGGAASLGGAVVGGNAAKSAANTQANAALSAQQQQEKQFETTQANLNPFIKAGQSAAGQLATLTGAGPGGNPLTSPLTALFQPTQAQLESTPGYQFSKTQGLEATQNSFAAQGLGQSGAALKGAANYAEGLAGTTFQQQFQNYLNQNQQVYSMLSGQAGVGENAAVGAGSLGQANVNAQSGLTTGAAAAQAAGTVGAANAIQGGLNGAAGSGLLYAAGQDGLFGNQGNKLTPGGYGSGEGQQVYTSPIGPTN